MRLLSTTKASSKKSAPGGAASASDPHLPRRQRLDRCVRGQGDLGTRALAVLDDPNRTFAASIFLKLEVLPQARFHKRGPEVAFYERFFAAVSTWATDLTAITEAALLEASTYGVEAMDALHVTAAADAGAQELVTLEKPTRTIHRARAVKVLSLYSDTP